MSQTKAGPAAHIPGVLATVLAAVAFFFTIIGVFGLSFAIAGLALAIVIAGFIIRRAPRGEDLP